MSQETLSTALTDVSRALASLQVAHPIIARMRNKLQLVPAEARQLATMCNDRAGDLMRASVALAAEASLMSANKKGDAA